MFPPTPSFAQIITDVIGNPEEERRAEFYQQPWAQEAVGRHIFAKVGSVPCWWGAAAGWGGSSGGVAWGSPSPFLTAPISSRSSSAGRNWNKCSGSASPKGPAGAQELLLLSLLPEPDGTSYWNQKYSTCTNPMCLEGFGATSPPWAPLGWEALAIRQSTAEGSPGSPP